MRDIRPMLALCLLVLILALPASAQRLRNLDYFRVLAMDHAAMRVKPVALLPVDADEGQKMVYGDRYGFLRVIQVTNDRVTEIWRSRRLEGGAVLHTIVEDLDGDGRFEIIAYNQQGRIFVFDADYSVRWESLPEDYRNITAMTVANVDDDLAYEIVLLSDGQLNYVDGQGFNREYQGTQSYQATEMAVGNVDTDLEMEIVLNTGTVIDVTRGEPEWETESFGEIVELVDIDGDGVEEILGYSLNQLLLIYDADERQEKPLR